MTKKILVATLGESPGVITEAIDALLREGIDLDWLFPFTTSDSDAKATLDFLQEHIPGYYREKPRFYSIDYIEAYEDITTSEAALEFLTRACEALRDLRQREWDSYVCIAGGRKTMSALMTLAVQFYGAKELFHIIADPEIEERGRIGKLRHQPPQVQNDLLHPPPEKVSVVKMPFIALFPWISDIIRTLKGEGQPPREVWQFLLANDFVTREGERTEKGNTLLEILQKVESKPPPYLGECTIHLNRGEPRFLKERGILAESLRHAFRFVAEIRELDWREGETGVKVAPPHALEVNYRLRGGPTLRFSLKTTAKTEGELEAARSQIERWLLRR
ncbi:CRISPR-associated ring nuclease [candidate division NPL-UPA2 bacterium]|nr:CRISPR-associated ring nuclease [candidate division NPL-UPA2 bacterium]